MHNYQLYRNRIWSRRSITCHGCACWKTRSWTAKGRTREQVKLIHHNSCPTWVWFVEESFWSWPQHYSYQHFTDWISWSY